MSAPPTFNEDPTEELVTEPGRLVKLAWVLIAIVCAGAVGFVIGRHTGRPSTTAAPRPIASVSSPAFSSTSSPASLARGAAFSFLTIGDSSCVVQTGRRLQYGIEVQNLGSTAVVLTSVKPVLSRQRITSRRVDAATCGQRGGAPLPTGIGPGSSEWITATFDPLSCPASQPMLFDVTYSSGTQDNRVLLSVYANFDATAPACGH